MQQETYYAKVGSETVEKYDGSKSSESKRLKPNGSGALFNALDT
mgnify:CR=1 FL=1